MKHELACKAGIDSLSDRYIVGAMAAYNDLLGIDLGDVNDN
jgi:hypothetical protein